MNTQEITLAQAVQLVERGREADVIRAYEMVTEAIEEGTTAAELADECGITKTTAGYYMLGATAWDKAEERDEFAANLRSAIIGSCKARGVKATRAMVEGEWSKLSELVLALDEEVVKPAKEEASEEAQEEATEEDAEESNDKTPLVDVVLAALPHLDTDDLARVWDALAELATVKAVELV